MPRNIYDLGPTKTIPASPLAPAYEGDEVVALTNIPLCASKGETYVVVAIHERDDVVGIGARQDGGPVAVRSIFGSTLFEETFGRRYVPGPRPSAAAPAYAGQKVSALKEVGPFKSGHTYTVLGRPVRCSAKEAVILADSTGYRLYTTEEVFRRVFGRPYGGPPPAPPVVEEKAPAPKPLRLVILESPFGAPTTEDVAENVAYAKRCLRDALDRGEAPIASHLLIAAHGVLDDNDPEDRHRGIEAGLAWYKQGVVEAAVVYVDRGISKGMAEGIHRAARAGIQVEFRFLDGGRI